MAAEPKRPALGRGLSALLGEDSDDYAQLDRLRTSRTVAIHLLRPSPFQPRRHMQEAELADLAQSIAAKGILQPLLVRRIADDPQAFEIIAGERRWRAAQMAQLHEVPVVIKELSDREALEIALIENLQRQDLTALEEAQGYRRLMDEFEHTQDALARAIGKSRSHVANTLRLLSLPDSVKRLLDDGSLSAGHARTLVGVEDADVLAGQIVKRGLNVRQTERLIAHHRTEPVSAPEPEPAKDPDTLALERDLSALLGLKAEIRFKRGGGALVLHYRTLEQLDELLRLLRRGGTEDVDGEGQA
ncbi:MAG: ParB/RepB/Spo0J family partition protein [Defluviicoccus sp.]